MAAVLFGPAPPRLQPALTNKRRAGVRGALGSRAVRVGGGERQDRRAPDAGRGGAEKKPSLGTEQQWAESEGGPIWGMRRAIG